MALHVVMFLLLVSCGSLSSKMKLEESIDKIKLNYNRESAKKFYYGVSGDSSRHYGDRAEGREIAHVVLHHTASKSVKSTIITLVERKLSVHYIVPPKDKDIIFCDRKGVVTSAVVFKPIEDEFRGMHAGLSWWGGQNDINDSSIGIEIVNSGDEPFPDEQVDVVSKVVGDIVKRYPIRSTNIVAHGDIALNRKQDPSGHFTWKRLYKNLQVFPKLFDMQFLECIETDQNQVLFGEKLRQQSDIKALQKNLKAYGYQVSESGKYDKMTQGAVEAFGRHFCSETFIKEAIKDNIVQSNDENKKWRTLHQKKLSYLLDCKQRGA